MSATLYIPAVFFEIEGLAFVALSLLARRNDLFVDLQIAIVPAAAFVALCVAAVFLGREVARKRRIHRYTTESVEEIDFSTIAQRIGMRAQ